MVTLDGLRQAARRRGYELLGDPRVLRVLAIPGVADLVTKLFVYRARLVNAVEAGITGLKESMKRRFKS